MLFTLIGCHSYQSTWAKADHKELPGIVGIAKRPYGKKPYGPKCSGTLIRPNVVLTAEHCTDDLSTDKIVIVYNCNQIYDSDCKTSNVFAKAERLDVDIALVFTEDDLREEGVRIAGIDNKGPEEGQFVLISGLGGRGEIALGMAPVYITGMHHFVTDFTNRTRPEPGDSGGPAYSMYGNKLMIVGITVQYMWTVDKEGRFKEDSFQGIKHVNIPAFADWINKTVESVNSNIEID
jgi:hypothetical protein